LTPSDIKIGTTYIKGKRKRTVVGLDGVFVVYTTPTSKKKGHVIGEIMPIFIKWAEKAAVST